ncbi:MAG TPA: hypothetical protein VFE31_11150 [Opitutaceae bacterium]|jgi:hypothetical protein|nr:hypothetical protein [Opitutaceae bacterium]
MNTDDLEDELRRQAAAIRDEPSPDLAARISAAIAAAAAETPGPRRGRAWGAWAGIGGVAAAAAIVGALILNRPAPPADPRAEAAALTQEMRGVPRQVWAAVGPRAEAVLQQDPLREETTALASDAQAAVGFLKYNFLPVSNG